MKKAFTETELMFDKLCKNDIICSCGKRHGFSLKKLLLHEGALRELPELLSALGEFKSIVMICDENTYRVAGAEVAGMLDVQTVFLSPYGLHANEAGVAAAETEMPDTCDLMLAVGSGTIHDITRYIACKRGVDFVSIPTAASVDGFVSSVAAMTWEGVKTTLTAKSPIAMVADSQIISKAPKKLTAAGVGDLLGKYIALFDWKLGHILTGEYYCPEIVKMEEAALAALVKNAELIAKGSRAATETLMYGLVLSGLAMQMAGNSRPASGAEHHISHCIEMGVFNPENHALHGEKVGVATCMVSDYYHSVIRLSPNDVEFKLENGVSELELKEVFGKLAPQIKDENKAPLLPQDIKEKLISKWGKICELITEIPSGNDMRELLLSCGGSISLSDIEFDEKLADKLFRYSPMVRCRLTLMRLLSYMNLKHH